MSADAVEELAALAAADISDSLCDGDPTYSASRTFAGGTVTVTFEPSEPEPVQPDDDEPDSIGDRSGCTCPECR